MTDTYLPQPGQCCGECVKLGEGRDYPMRCGPTGLCVDREDGTACRIFTRREPEPKPVEPVTVTLRRESESVLARCKQGTFQYETWMPFSPLRDALAAGPVTLTIPPQPCVGCLELIEEIGHERDARSEQKKIVRELRDERDAARAEAEALRAQLAERDAEIERLREIIKRMSPKVDAIGELADELELQVACMDLHATRGDA